MTFSIAARCPRTGMLGVAVASRFLAVGALCPYARPGTGAIATQALVNPLYGVDGLDMLGQGATAPAVLERLIGSDAGREYRQVGVVDREGLVAAHTGRETVPWSGHRVGSGFTCQGNMLTGPEVVARMVLAYEAGADLDLPERLMAALTAGEAAGGDKRGKQGAALLVVDTQPYPYVDLRVDDHADPVTELSRLLQMHREFVGLYRDLLPTRENPSGVVDPEAIAAVRARNR